MIRPAQGEGAAVGGYHYQYRASAFLVLRGLMDGSLRWVRIKDVEAGRVDDFITASDDSIDGYQFKHRAAPGRYTFRDLVHSEAAERQQDHSNPAEGQAQPHRSSLIRQLADGWLQLRRTHATRVVVHLATNAPPSEHDRINVPENACGPKHLSEFLREAWDPARAMGPGLSLPGGPKWTHAWSELRNASGLDYENFVAFVRHCRLDFQVRPESFLVEESDRDAVQAEIDVNAIRHLLFDVAALERAPIELDRRSLLERLGWTNRFQSFNPHNFPIDDILYQPIQRSADDLETAIKATTRGYIGVLGSPGSGKSSLLTQALRYRPERVVRYYAFVPGASGLDSGRGESENFLHDLVWTLHQHGISPGDATIGFDRLTLLERLHAQMDLLNRDWERTGRKTLILVDGLDHVTRFPQPARPFLDDLPSPNAIPNGVVFILGSQTQGPLSDAIQQEIEQPQRRIEMRPLTREDILEVIAKAALPSALLEDQASRVVELSQGHPLALVYLLNALRYPDQEATAQSILDQTPTFTGDIVTRYRAAWAQIAGDSNAVLALGYAARIRGPIDLNWLQQHIDFAAVRALGHRFGHFFRRAEGGRRYFFHDSFRQVLLEKTSETWAGDADQVRDANLHRQIADWLAAEPEGSPRAWDELYHRTHGGQHGIVVERATQDYFRKQVLALRPPTAIRADIVLALEAAARQRNPVTFVRALLAGTELSQRSWQLDLGSLVRLLIGLGEPLVAAAHIHEGYRLDASAQDALDACSMLEAAGVPAEAARIFELAEPLDLLSGEQPIPNEPHDKAGDLLAVWAEVATRYRPLENIIAVARRLTVQPNQWQKLGQEQASRELQDSLIYHAGRGLIEDQRWDDLDMVLSALDPDGGSEPGWWFWLHAHGWDYAANVGDIAMARKLFKTVIERFTAVELGHRSRVAVAQAAYRIAGDPALSRRWIDGVPQPEFDPLRVPSDAGFEPFMQRFRLNRLLSALGDPLDPLQLVVDPEERPRPGTTKFERFICVVADIAGTAWRGERLLPATIVGLISPHLVLFDRSLEYWSLDTSWYLAERARAGLVEKLVHAVADHGHDAVDALRSTLERAWNITPWTLEDRRAAVIALARVGAPNSWAVGYLKELEDQGLGGKLTFERVKECQQQAEAWLALGERGAALGILNRLIIESNAVSRKDYQLTYWISEWLPLINAAAPERAVDRVRWFANASLLLSNITEDGEGRSAAQVLLGAAFRWSPCRAVRLLVWYLDRSFVVLDESLEVLLTAALDSDTPPIQLIWSLLVEVVLLVAVDGPSTRLLKKLVASEASNKDQQAAVNAVELLAEHAAKRAHPSSRSEWHRRLAEALDTIGINPADARLDLLSPNETTVSPTTASAHPDPEGSEQDQDDSRMVGSVAALQGILAQESTVGFRDWTPAVRQLAVDATADEIAQLIAMFRGHGYEAKIMTGLSEELIRKGDRDSAFKALIGVLSANQSWGWDHRWGGSDKLNAALRLVQLDRTAAEPLVYDTLAKDLSTDLTSFGSIALSLHAILPLLVDPIPVSEIWSEIDVFVHALFAAHEMANTEFEFLDEAPKSDSVADGLGDLVTELMHYPAAVVAQATQRVCALGITQNDPSLLAVAKNGLGGGTDLCLRVLQALDAVMLTSPQQITPLRQELISLSASQDYAARSIATDLCRRMGWQPDLPPRIEMPAFYRLVLPPELRQELQLYAINIKVIARLARLPEGAIYRRAASLMRTVAEPHTWSQATEDHISEQVHRARVYLPIRRPRMLVARAALFRVVAELIDSGDLDEKAVTLLAPFLRIHDPAMVLLVPSTRPETIWQMAEPGYKQGSDDEWIAEVGEVSSRLVERLASSSVLVLAEKSEFRQVGTRYPTEKRSVHIHRATNGVTPGAENKMVRHVVSCPLMEYPSVQESRESLVLENREGNAYDTPSPNWLGLNPAIGRALGWRLTPSTLPHWVSKGGESMAWTVWWTDGILDSNWAAPTAVVGEGWLVLASPAGADQIRAAIDSLRYQVSVTRRLNADRSKPNREQSSSCVISF